MPNQCLGGWIRCELCGVQSCQLQFADRVQNLAHDPCRGKCADLSGEVLAMRLVHCAKIEVRCNPQVLPDCLRLEAERGRRTVLRRKFLQNDPSCATHVV